MKDARHESSRDAVREDGAETVHKVMRPEPVLELEVEGIPRRTRREELALLLTSLLPRNARSDSARIRLLHAEPAVFERLVLVTDVAQPAVLFARRDTIRLREYAWKHTHERTNHHRAGHAK